MDAFGGKQLLYAACVSPLEDARLYAAAYETASCGRREKTDRFRLPGDKRRSLGAELLLRHGLRAAGAEQSLEELDYGVQEKPYLKPGGLWFNVSHSGTWVVCAFAEREVGCDVEEIRPIDLKLARRFRQEEYDDIFAQPTEEARLDRFYRYWTLKESFMKATGLGMQLPLNAFQIRLGEEISVTHSLDGHSYSFREFRELPGFRCALCVEGDCCDAKLQVVDLADLL